MTTQPIAVLALGGNALIEPGETGTFAEQQAHARAMVKDVAIVIERGYLVALTHGNGPVVGNLLIQNEAAKATVAPMPLDVCDADSEGSIGYLIQQSLHNELWRRGERGSIVTLVTQVVVDPKDPAFSSPSKPIGPFFGRAEADRLTRETGVTMVEDAGRGYRRVVPSPPPIDLVEGDVVTSLVKQGVIVIAAGGGGIPVERLDDGTLRGVEAVVDKDRAASLMGRLIGAELLVLLTGIDAARIDFRKPTERSIGKIDVSSLEALAREGQFAPGSMGPKVEASIEFVRRGGRQAIITSPSMLAAALDGKAGTIVLPDAPPTK